MNRCRAMRWPSMDPKVQERRRLRTCLGFPHFEAPLPLRARSIRLHSQHYEHQQTHNDSPVQAHRSHLAPATVVAAPAHPPVLDSTHARRLLYHPTCSRHDPRQPYTWPTTEIHHLDRRHRTGAMERAVARREGCTDNAAVVQLGRCSHWRHRNSTSCP